MNKSIFSLIITCFALAAASTTPCYAQSASNFSKKAQTAINHMASQPNLKHANLSICIAEVSTGKAIASHNPDLAVGTASTMKTVTSAAALELLGPNFRFNTRVYAVGKFKNGNFRGNIIVKGDGDPTLGSRHFPKMPDITQVIADSLAAKGFKKIQGDVVSDESIYPYEPVSDWWGVDDTFWEYGTGVHALSFSDNTIKLTFNREDSVPSNFTLTPNPGIAIDSHLSYSANPQLCGSTTYGKYPSLMLWGTVRREKTPWTSLVANPIPAITLCDSIKATLKANSIKFKEKHIKHRNAPDTILIAEYQSPRLAEILNSLLLRSDNMFTDAVLKALGYRCGSAGTRTEGIKVVKTLWKRKGIDTDPLFMFDGCGLARSGKATGRFFTQMLSQVERDAAHIRLHLSSIMTCVGKTGKIGKLIPSTALNGKIASKSGSMTDVLCYVGYFPADKPKYAFAVLVNNFHGSFANLQNQIDQLLISTFAE
mgnify:FL=1